MAVKDALAADGLWAAGEGEDTGERLEERRLDWELSADSSVSPGTRVKGAGRLR